MTNPRDITEEEARRIGFALHDPFVFFGHPLTCNGGNQDFSTHHDHEVLMQIDGQVLVCPECSRKQELPDSALQINPTRADEEGLLRQVIHRAYSGDEPTPDEMHAATLAGLEEAERNDSAREKE